MISNEPYTLDLLTNAWEEVRRRNPVPGLDQLDVRRFQRGLRRRLRSLSNALNACRYVPEPARGVRIPKSDGSTRLLMIPGIRDRLAQVATRALLEPIWEPQFLDCSYAYRPGKGHHKALGRVEHYLRSGREWIAKADIDDFFGSIRHDLLLRQLRQSGVSRPVLHVVELWVKMGYLDSRGLEPQDVGVPQGSIISPLLANIYLHPFDLALRMRGYQHVRYADDYIILCGSRREAEEARQFAAGFLDGQLGLRLNGAGNLCTNLRQGFVFLGLEFQGRWRRIAPEKLEKAKSRLAEVCQRLKSASLEELVAALNVVTRAWQYYYRRCNDKRCFRELDEALEEAVIEWARGRKQPLPRSGRRVLLGLERMSERTPRVRARANRELLADVAAVAHVAKDEKDRRQGRARKGRHAGQAIEGRRRHYDRQVALDGTLLVVRSGSVVGVWGQEVRVRYQGRVTCRRHLKQLRHVVLAGERISFSSDLLNRCAEHGVTVEAVDFAGRTVARLSSPAYGDPQVWEAQLRARSTRKGCLVARSFVLAKVENQLRLLKYWDKYWRRADPALDRLFEEESRRMDAAVRAVELTALPQVSGAELAEWANLLRGYEGQAAVSYWTVVSRALPAVYGFAGRVHQGEDPVNQMLNYGYGVLYGRAHAALSAAGLNPHWGFLHRSAKKPGLVYDFVEMFRPWAVDRVVFSLVGRGVPASISEGRLTDETRRRLLKEVLERLGRSIRYRQERLTLEEVMYRQAQELADYITGKRDRYRPLLMRW